LVNRSQKDPLLVDDTAPQHVLVPLDNYDTGAASSAASEQSFPPEKRKKEQSKYGIFFDDEYDYLQHLRQPGKNEVHWEEVPHKHADEKNKPKLQLPSSVFASEFEEQEGLLAKAVPLKGPRPDWDPDIVEALDDDFDFENPTNALEDNFMELAMGGEDGDESWDEDDDDEYSDVSSNQGGYSDEEDDELGPLPGTSGAGNFDSEETKSRFTEYSISSSVIRRNEQLTLLDDRFEKFYENYDDPELGALDCEEIEGHVDINDELLLQCATEFKKTEVYHEYQKEWDIIRMVKLQQEGGEKPEEMVALEVSDDDEDTKKKKKWDCESILSTYSNCYNHPKLIDMPSKKKKMEKIQINPRTGIPMNVLDNDQKNKLTERLMKEHNIAQHESTSAGPKSLCAESVLSTLSVLSIRPKDEKPEEKRERKKLLKEYRNERRIEKKANKLAFNEERLRQQVDAINAKNSLQGNKIL